MAHVAAGVAAGNISRFIVLDVEAAFGNMSRLPPWSKCLWLMITSPTPACCTPMCCGPSAGSGGIRARVLPLPPS